MRGVSCPWEGALGSVQSWVAMPSGHHLRSLLASLVQRDLMVAQAWTLPRRGLALETPTDISGDADTLLGTGWLEMVCPVSDDQASLTLC